MRTHMRPIFLLSVVVVLALSLASSAAAGTVVDGTDVKVISDNNNVDGGTPNPSFDAQNRQQNETTVAISPVDPKIIAVGANDYRMVTVTGDGWLGFYVSLTSGATWFNTFVPGFVSDTSTAGLASPLLGLDGSGDPVVRFDGQGNLYVGGIAFNRDFDQADLNNDTVAYVAKYNYTPGTPAGVSTPNSAGNPPSFTYAYTTIVDRGAIGFAIPPGQRWGSAGIFPDKNWLATDTNPNSACYGNVYFSFTKFTGSLGGSARVQFSVSDDGGASFSEPKSITQGGKLGTNFTQTSFIAVAPNGRIYVAYRTFITSSDSQYRVMVVRSDDCGRTFGKPVSAAVFTPMLRQEPGLNFRTPVWLQAAVDDTNPDIVYIAYNGVREGRADADVLVVRSTDGGLTWSAPTVVNDDVTSQHQFWPTIQVANGVLHTAWYDLRNSIPAADNNALDVYYAFSTATSFPDFSSNERVTDISHNANCLMFGGGTAGFHGDYIELAARYDGSGHTIHVVWTDNRDVSPCDLDPAPGPASDNTGNRNQNVYFDTLTVNP